MCDFHFIKVTHKVKAIIKFRLYIPLIHYWLPFFNLNVITEIVINANKETIGIKYVYVGIPPLV